MSLEGNRQNVTVQLPGNPLSTLDVCSTILGDGGRIDRGVCGWAPMRTPVKIDDGASPTCGATDAKVVPRIP